jgi:hypothetical protein
VRRAALGGLALAASLAVAFAAASPQRAASGGTVPLLPDLDQVTPYQVGVTTVVRRGRPLHRLVFASAVENRGEGDMILVGHRASRRVPTMTADQYVNRVSLAGRPAGQTLVRDVGRLRYVVSPDHAHWHLLGFERYELRFAKSGRLAVRDRKTGFCVGNRYRFDENAAASAVGVDSFDPNCGRTRTGLLRVVEGLSPGWADDYRPQLEGQFLELAGVHSGRYVLVHRTNVAGRLHEATRVNNAASVLLELRRRAGAAPTVRVLRRCPGTATCRALP